MQFVRHSSPAWKDQLVQLLVGDATHERYLEPCWEVMLAGCRRRVVLAGVVPDTECPPGAVLTGAYWEV